MSVVCFITALSFISPQNAAIIQPAIPVFTTLMGVLARYEQFSWRKALGVLCAVSGALSGMFDLSSACIASHRMARHL